MRDKFHLIVYHSSLSLPSLLIFDLLSHLAHLSFSPLLLSIYLIIIIYTLIVSLCTSDIKACLQ